MDKIQLEAAFLAAKKANEGLRPFTHNCLDVTIRKDVDKYVVNIHLNRIDLSPRLSKFVWLMDGTKVTNKTIKALATSAAEKIIENLKGYNTTWIKEDTQ